jgi:hypothetical protein
MPNQTAIDPEAASAPDAAPEVDLTPPQQAFLLALLECRTVTEAAAHSGTPPRTAWRWLKTPEFQAALRDHRRRAFAGASVRLAAGHEGAVDFLTALVANDEAPFAARIQAARTLMTAAHRTLALDDLASDLATMESHLRPQTPNA